jgi:hypothetical protein
MMKRQGPLRRTASGWKLWAFLVSMSGLLAACAYLYLNGMGLWVNLLSLLFLLLSLAFAAACTVH